MSDQAPVFLQAENLTKSFGALRALRGVDFSAARGEVIGLIGANGAGKSTLIKTLTGSVAADSGTIRVDGEEVRIAAPDDALELGIAAVQQEVVLAHEHSLAENVLLGRFPSVGGFVNKRRLRAQARELLGRVGVNADPDAPAATLTPAQQRLVMVAAALARNPRLLILDEPTAALPPQESAVVTGLVQSLSAEGVAIVYVSHRLHEVARLAGRVVALRDGAPAGVLERGDVDEQRMLAMIGGGGAAERLASPSQASEQAVEHSRRRARDAGRAPMLRLRGVSGARVRGLDLDAHRGEILGIAGLAGAGRSELLRLIFGLQALSGGQIEFLDRPLSGSPRERVKRGIGYFAERRATNALHGLNVSSNMTINSVGAHKRAGVFLNRRWERDTVRRIGADVSLVGSPVALIETLSGGNQQKVLIGRWLARGVEMMLLDEPTAGVDLHARAEIHQLLRTLADEGKSLIIASVEEDELTLLCDRVIVLVEGEHSGELTAPFTEQELITAFYRRRSRSSAEVAEARA